MEFYFHFHYIFYSIIRRQSVMMRSLLIFCEYFFLRYSLSASDFRIVSVTCRSFQRTIVNFECDSTNYTTSLALQFFKPLHSAEVIFLLKQGNSNHRPFFQAKFEFFKMIDDKYHPHFKSPMVDWCKLMDGVFKSKSFVKQFIDGLKDVAPQFVHSCPYTGEIAAKNIKFLKNFMAFCPTGKFKLKITATDKISDLIMFTSEFIVF